MKRDLICVACAKRYELHPEDVANGLLMRKKILTVKKPKNLTIEIQTQGMIEVINVDQLICDFCNEQLPNGSVAVAVTMWDKNKEGEPGDWEQEYQ